MPPLIYAASVIHVPTQVFKETKEIINLFLWNSKIPKVAYNVVTQEINHGGLKLVDFEEKAKALNVSWVKRLASETKTCWKAIPSHIYNCDSLSFYFICTQLPIKHLSSRFYNDIHN